MAVVQKLIPHGRHGPYAVATSNSMKGCYITFSLRRDIWREKRQPEPGLHVMLSDIRKKERGWRAYRARFVRWYDEPD